jgi:hypothetical protein
MREGRVKPALYSTWNFGISEFGIPEFSVPGIFKVTAIFSKNWDWK